MYLTYLHPADFRLDFHWIGLGEEEELESAE